MVKKRETHLGIWMGYHLFKIQIVYQIQILHIPPALSQPLSPESFRAGSGPGSPFLDDQTHCLSIAIPLDFLEIWLTLW
jgi:hypothetical protein